MKSKNIAQQSVKIPDTIELTNAELQRIIQGINSLGVAKTLLSAKNAFALAVIAQKIDTAFAPCAKIIEEYRKDFSEQAGELRKLFESDEAFGADSETQSKISILENQFQIKINELLELKVIVSMSHLNQSVFTTTSGKDVDIAFDTLMCFLPIIKKD